MPYDLDLKNKAPANATADMIKANAHASLNLSATFFGFNDNYTCEIMHAITWESLKCLNLFHCALDRLTQNTWELFCNHIQTSGLNKLNIGRCGLEMVSLQRFEQLFAAIKANSNLHYINLNHSYLKGISSEKFLVLCDYLQSCPRNMQINLKDNDFTLPQVTKLQQACAKNEANKIEIKTHSEPFGLSQVPAPQVVEPYQSQSVKSMI